MTTSILLNTDQVKDSVGMPREFGHLGERGVLPNKDLVLRISMCADLQKRFKKKPHPFVIFKKSNLNLSSRV